MEVPSVQRLHNTVIYYYGTGTSGLNREVSFIHRDLTQDLEVILGVSSLTFQLAGLVFAVIKLELTSTQNVAKFSSPSSWYTLSYKRKILSGPKPQRALSSVFGYFRGCLGQN